MDTESNKSKKNIHTLTFVFIISVFFFFSFLQDALAQENGNGSVELNGDVVEYSLDRQTVFAKGNVTVVSGNTTLECDEVEYSRDKKIAHARGNVRLTMENGEIAGSKLTFNFGSMQGDFKNAKIVSEPFYGEGREIFRVDENEVNMTEGYITTCDHDKPHFRLFSPKIDVYPKEKIVARNVRLVLGNVPIMYFPRYTQRLDGKPRFTFTPGYDKDWGVFLLTQYRYYLNENIKGVLHFDVREKRDVAWGIDVDYKTPNIGTGIVKTYYTNERRITSDRFFQQRPTPTIEKERFKVEWRHKWDIDDKTNMILQYYKLSDDSFLKEYFEREFEEDSSPATFFLLTKNFGKGVLSFRTDARVNRFESALERLPEIRFDLSNQELGDTGLYLKSISSFANLSSKEASPSEIRRETKRFDTDNEISYPMKVGFVEFKPFVGTQQTYYTKTKDRDKYDSIRGIFRTGASLSTKFYRVFDVHTDRWGLDINRLRHVITPSIDYQYVNDPTILSSELDQFDAIDGLARSHNINFSLENKLQTKRKDKSVDLVRAVIGTDFHLKEDTRRQGFDSISTDIDFRPSDWLTLYFDSEYDTRNERLSTANFDLYINGPNDKWTWGLGKRYNREVDDQITTEFKYQINHKWAFRLYERIDVLNGTLKEQEYTLTRDLHEWVMDLNYNETRGEGAEIWVIFTLKGFPDITIDAGTGFNKRKAGSQSPGSE